MRERSVLRTVMLVSLGLLICPLVAAAESLDYKPEPTPDIYQPKSSEARPDSAPEATPFAEHFLVFQASRPDKWSQVLALNNAANTKAA